VVVVEGGGDSAGPRSASAWLDPSLPRTPAPATLSAALRGSPAPSPPTAPALQHLLGPDWRQQLPASPAARRYAAHLEALGRRDPALLLPYAYSLYVPLLIGLLGQQVKKTLGLQVWGWTAVGLGSHGAGQLRAGGPAAALRRAAPCSAAPSLCITRQPSRPDQLCVCFLPLPFRART